MTVDDIDLFDLYSCFPVAVFNVRDGLGVAANDSRPLTVTGGLPYFGGAGNNYSMHGIASMMRRLRAEPRARGLVAANGGYLSKYSVGVYSARPSEWRGFSSEALQAEIDAWPAPAIVPGVGEGLIETYTIDYAPETPVGIVVARVIEGGGRFVAMTDPEDGTLVKQMIAADPLGAAVTVEQNAAGRAVIVSFRPASGRRA